MRTAQALVVLLFATVALTGCSVVNGTESLREEQWTRSDGAVCSTRWTLVVVNGFDTEDGPIEQVRDAFRSAAPTSDEVAIAKELLAREYEREFGEPGSDDVLRFETYALATAVESDAIGRLEADGLGADLARYDLGSEVDCD